jgi:hypothetical protein
MSRREYNENVGVLLFALMAYLLGLLALRDEKTVFVAMSASAALIGPMLVAGLVSVRERRLAHSTAARVAWDDASSAIRHVLGFLWASEHLEEEYRDALLALRAAADSIQAFLKDSESQFIIQRIAEIERLLRTRTNDAVTSTELQGLAAEVEGLWRPARQSLLLHLPRARDV